MTFKDHFSGHAEQYAKFRPIYPPELFAYLADACGRRGHAWDCATGNGQAAVGLARYFETVTGTDASGRQIAAAVAHPRVAYRVATADDCGLHDDSVDLVVVAQALHWFDIDEFYREVRRVARDDTLLAVWYYFAGLIDGPIGNAIREFDREIVHDYWPREARAAQRGYRNFAFPFRRIATPAFEMRVEWTIDSLCGYLATWSATRRYQAARGVDPLPRLRRRLLQIWPEPDSKVTVRWPLDITIGRVSKHCDD